MGNFTLGFCFWDIPAVIAFGIAISLLVIQQRKHKARMQKLRDKNN